MKTNDIIDPALVQADRIMTLEQEVNKLRNENAALRRELYPPKPEQKELKYWIVTWLWQNQAPYATVISNWSDVLKEQDWGKRHQVSHINILEQRVLL